MPMKYFFMEKIKTFYLLTAIKAIYLYSKCCNMPKNDFFRNKFRKIYLLTTKATLNLCLDAIKEEFPLGEEQTTYLLTAATTLYSHLK